MKRSAYGQPIIIKNETLLCPKQEEAVNEKYIQELILIMQTVFLFQILTMPIHRYSQSAWI